MGQMEILKQQILDACNNSQLPLECIVYVLKDAWRDASDTFRSVQEQQEKQKASEEVVEKPNVEVVE